MFKPITMAAAAVLAMLVPSAAGAQSTAPGQAKADYHAWLARSAENRDRVRAFQTYLDGRSAKGVVPTWQLLRTSSSWRECSAERFAVAPAERWQNIVDTLLFVRNEVSPVIGEVKALSGFRDRDLNSCSGGRPRSAHGMFSALDLVPTGDVDRTRLVSLLCRVHSLRGALYQVGLGFYGGLRFHLDTNGYRRWGSNGRASTSPCASI